MDYDGPRLTFCVSSEALHKAIKQYGGQFTIGENRIWAQNGNMTYVVALYVPDENYWGISGGKARSSTFLAEYLPPLLLLKIVRRAYV